MSGQDWDDYRFLLAVAREKTLTAAAAALGVDQTTVSRRLRSMQDRSSGALFEQLRARDGEMMRWMMFMPSSAARNAAVRSLPPEASVRAEELEPGVVRLLDTGLLDPKNKAWEAGGVKK